MEGRLSKGDQGVQVSLSTTKLIPRSLTAALSLIGIRSLVDFGKLVGPLGHPVALPPIRNMQRCT